MTIDIDDELMVTINEIAHRRKATTGEVVSSLLRESLQFQSSPREYRNGVPLLPRRPNGWATSPITENGCLRVEPVGFSNSADCVPGSVERSL